MIESMAVLWSLILWPLLVSVIWVAVVTFEITIVFLLLLFITIDALRKRRGRSTRAGRSRFLG
jgi:hypothetical protein